MHRTLFGTACLLLTSYSGAAQASVNADSGYVDSAVCAGCHPDIAKTYRLTGMARSFYRPNADNIVEDYQTYNSVYHRASDRHYIMMSREGKFFQRRYQIGFDGKQTNIEERQIDFVIGSGNHARTYLHRTQEGKLIELPVSWYSEKGGYWAMSPGYDHPAQEDFRRAIPYDCMFCHNAYPSLSALGTKRSDTEPFFGDRLPNGIDCQRCHGPGRAHVTAAGSGHASSLDIRRAIVNPARLSRDRQMEVCMQCHLETTSAPLPHAIRRYDRTTFSYRPGEPLIDYVLTFDRSANDNDRFEIAHAAYRLRKSVCFKSSQMTCTTCHNPHQIPSGREATAHYVSVCRSCHSAAHASSPQAAANCMGCHMPKRRAQDAVHVVMTDHYIRRDKPPGDLLASFEEAAPGASPYRGEVTLYYPSQLPETSTDELYLAVAQVQDAANLQSGIQRLERLIEKRAPRLPQFYFELGRAYSKTGKYDESIRWYEEALHRDPEFLPAVKELVGSLFSMGRLERATEVLEKAPPDAVILTNLGNAYLREKKIDRAAQALSQALHINPESPEIYNLLGLICLKHNDRSAAEKNFRKAISLDPDLAVAHNNLANLLITNRDYEEAKYHFEKAITADSAYAEAHHGYGLLLELMHSYDQAEAQFRESLRLNPKSAQTHMDLGDLLAARGQNEAASAEYQRAREVQNASH